ncbi:EST gb/R65024 comes from this gene [Arabidopsis thaliana]|uniref:F9K20.6 protein n=1 Tax=Arabidopsis thaliana TaxID=3702 RepID=Q9ZVA8_ARATH|nr:EST gb/R65024 comes from this gene [Arabidopsis thaliana]
MARSLSPSLSLSRYRFAAASLLLPSSQTIFIRSQSSNRRSNSNHLGVIYEIDIAADPLVNKLEDAVHRIMVRRSAPDWLPFVPGASFWVPPPRSQSHGIAKLVEKLANPISDEESISISSVRGWPCSDYFIKGGVKPQSVETEMTSNTAYHSEDEE